MLSGLWVPAVFGAIGAIANCILLEGGFTSPRKVLKESNKTVWDLGFIGTILLGAIAAVATYLLGTYELPPMRQFGISLIAGVGGGNILTSLAQKYESQVLKLQIDELQASLEDVLGGKSK
ncbi:MAG: hypothetical protein ACRD3J_02660 [Thermoanaerobaculia bacterium]